MSTVAPEKPCATATHARRPGEGRDPAPFPRYPEYKDSGVEWLDEVPAHWVCHPLWSMFRRVKRVNHQDKQLLSVYRDFGVIPKSSRDDNFNKPSDDLALYQLVEPGDLAINKMKAWQGSAAISEFEGIVSPAYFVYEAKHEECSKYLHYLLRSDRYTAGYLSMSKGIRVNQWDLDPAYHSRMSMLLPPKEEQIVIATFLDRETARIDALIAEQEKLITLLKEKRQALISHAVTKGLDPNARMKDSGIEWLGQVPAHWDIRALRTLASVVRGASPRPAGDPNLFDGDFIPWVTVAEITKDESPDLTATSEYLTELGAQASRTFRAGTLLYSNSGATLGVPKLLCMDACANDGVVGFESLAQSLTTDFLYWFLRSLTPTIRDLVKQGSGQPNLNTGIVGSIRVGLPPVDEQAVIVDSIKITEGSFSTLSDQCSGAIELLKERRAALISAAVTGKIDVRDMCSQSTKSETYA